MGEFYRPEEVRAFQIVVHDEGKAKEIIKKLKKGSRFKEMARKHSISPERDKDGDLGYFALGEMPMEFEDAIFPLSKGKISNVVHTPFGFHIFKLVDKRKARELTFGEVSDEIAEKLKVEKQERFLREWLKILKKQTRVKINEEVLKEIQLSEEF